MHRQQFPVARHERDVVDDARYGAAGAGEPPAAEAQVDGANVGVAAGRGGQGPAVVDERDARYECAEVPAGVPERQGALPAERLVPEQRQVDAWKKCNV